MSLSLPADIEPFLDDTHAFERIRGPACYLLSLERPSDVREAWNETFDVLPAYMDELESAQSAVYVGAANDLLRRLNDHANGEKRKAALLEVCDVVDLVEVWWFDSVEKAFERESMIATNLANEMSNVYVHQR